MGRVSCRVLHSLIFVALLCVSPAVHAAAISAHETVQNATESLLKKLADTNDIYAQDPLKFYHAVDSALAPYIDFDKFSRGVMAKYYKRATPAQRQRFKLVFKDDLIKTYAKALLEFDNERIRVLPADDAKPQRGNKTTVRMEIYSKSGSIYPVDYTTMLTNGEWKLINVVVNGVNLGFAFRDKFRNAMGANKGDVDRVIDGWNSKVTTGK